ncbi:probable LRR receptor-like serine/threonine-protein kinase At3g47570 [Asparagus officinalis]|uniref:probable LRR receptor-like serine/threonine-protein kinase At3g47570 n=1 Tax=Asparagus officinalis TaxID=4686 RepID=UPI00098E1496|nr:probable LRR receptor-like serine/threonine-protein kinase At3g47570 [Asparagus officinalis]
MAHLLVFSVFTSIVIFSCPQTSTSITTFNPKHNNVTDRQALLSFKSMISSYPRRSLTAWNDSIHFCHWPGITCGGLRHPQRVISLNLSSLDLVGVISTAIANLTFLRKIDLSNNQINGSIPQEIGRLPRLRYLYLSLNSLEGGIPASFSHCSKLEVLSLSNNKLQGEIPASLSNCTSLQILNLSNNSLTGYIPPSLTRFSVLSILSVSGNGLYGSIPPSIGNISSLTSLSLDNNELIGSIPHSIGGLSELEELHLSFNILSGVITPSLWNLSSLSYLDLSFNYHLSGSLPPNVGRALPLLEVFDLDCNQFHGPIPMSLSNASHLRDIDLSKNSFSGIIPPSLGSLQELKALRLYVNHLEIMEPDGWNFLTALTNCTHLRVLGLASNNLSGMLPNSIANFSTNLQFLSMHDNNISGTISSDIGNLANLLVFKLHGNLLHGSIPSSIGMLHQLNLLELDNNKLSGEIPSTIGNLTQLNSIHLESNELSGNIPASLGKCQNLILLHLDSNKLTGIIPKEIFSITGLAIALRLASNSLSGLIPFEVGNLRNLNALDVSMNKLSGEIPSTLSECQVLQELYLGGNLFEGSIPSSLAWLRGIQKIDVSKNNFSGKIPYFLQDFHLLDYLNLSFNNFEGEVPQLGVFENASAVSVIGNDKLCGANPAMHLPACPSEPFIKKGDSHSLIMINGITISFVFLILLFCFFVVRRRRKSSRRRSHELSPANKQNEKVSFSELVKATNGFSEDNIIGTGSFGTVYKGLLHGESRKVVAIKVLNLQIRGASRSFLSECEALKNIRHRNLLKILTICSSVDFKGNDFKAVVFEFMDNGNLDDWLHPKANVVFKQKKLNLAARLNIAIDVASALHYLHHQCGTPIIHSDLKPSNILLDVQMTAHVGDFGLARLLTEIVSKSCQNSTSSVGLRGTIGYIAPEYGVANKASTNGDVYSYGILLLEMITAKRPTDDTFVGGHILRKFVEMGFPDRITDIIDSHLLLLEDGKANGGGGGGGEDDGWRLNDERIVECASSLLRLGILCTNELPEERMEMGDVSRELHKIRDVFLRNGTPEEGGRYQMNGGGPSLFVQAEDSREIVAVEESNL